MATDLASAIARAAPGDRCPVVPPHAYLGTVADASRGAGASAARTAGVRQRCLYRRDGRHVARLRLFARDHRHSERRQFFGDTAARTVAKVEQAHAAGLVSVFCVGETLAERRAGATEAAIEAQLGPLLETADVARLLPAVVIAYEPVWAIGTGETATPAQAQAVHAWIRARVAQAQPKLSSGLRIVYGGSVKSDNAAELFAMPISMAAWSAVPLEASSFLAICRAAV